jgi:ribosomal protein S3
LVNAWFYKAAYNYVLAGEKGRRIRELTSVVQKRFNFPPETVELYAEKVANRGLCAVAQAESLRYKLLGGLAVRRCGAWVFGVQRVLVVLGRWTAKEAEEDFWNKGATELSV